MRFTPFGVQLQEATSATHSSIIIEETDWSDPTAGLNDNRRGGVRLERLIVDFGLSVQANADFWRNSGNGNIALIPEFMLHLQSDQFATVVTDSTSFAATRSNMRLLMDEVPTFESFTQISSFTNEQSIRTVRGRYETKVKARLAELALVVSWRGLFDTGSANLQGYTDWVRPTLLISQP